MAATLTSRDRAQLAARGISEEEALRQLALLRDPPPAARLLRPATVGDGILTLDEAALRRLRDVGLAAARAGRVGRFVPASGAATRMFAGLLAARSGEDDESSRCDVATFVSHRDQFPFVAELRREAGPAWDGAERDPLPLLAALLDPDRLAFADRPKGLIPFHRTGDVVSLPFEEHLAEAAALGRDAGGRVRAHFTVSPEHRAAFERRLATVRDSLEAELTADLAVTFSAQSPSTDTLAATSDGEPFRLDDGSLLFRPGGHGALLGNLETCDGELIVVKNIDNVLPAWRRGPVIAWKAVLVGLAAELAAKIDDLLTRLDEGRLDDAALADGLHFAATELGRRELDPVPHGSPVVRREALRTALARPLRVAGVVPNRGEPGGGPFWVESDGRASLQIVETSQIDRRSPEQAAVLAAATHFNPVDLVVRVRDRHGRRFPLQTEPFVDPRTSFVATKSYGGRPLRALERPGLWNGGMAGWNTVFVEVPGETFAPVKTVFDLLRPEHQPETRSA